MPKLPAVTLPARFRATIASTFGAAGAAWLDALPAQLAHYADVWRLTIGPPFALSYNYVCAATRADGTPVVLKLGPPGIGLDNEAAALRHYDGRGALRLLATDPPHEVLLLERLLPGTPLAALADDDAATHCAADVMQQLWRPPADGARFPPLAQWANGLARLRAAFDGGCGPFPPALVALAEQLWAELLPSADEAVVLHGDLHHYNILAAGERCWLAIDPKGIVGERAAEVAALLSNPYAGSGPDPVTPQRLVRRLALLDERLPCDPQRVRAYAVALTVLGAWWDYEDGVAGWPRALQIAAWLAALR